MDAGKSAIRSAALEDEEVASIDQGVVIQSTFEVRMTLLDERRSHF